MQFALLSGFSTMFKALFGRSLADADAHALYGRVVARARAAGFYTDFGVADTFDGRFEVLVLHLFLVHSRLRDEALPARRVSQRVFDLFIDDMDSALREAGVGDQTVPKRIAKMTQVFYGRSGAYEKALASSNPKAALHEVIARNAFPDESADGREAMLADYLLEQFRHLAELPVDQIVTQHRLFDQALVVNTNIRNGKIDV